MVPSIPAHGLCYCHCVKLLALFWYQQLDNPNLCIYIYIYIYVKMPYISNAYSINFKCNTFIQCNKPRVTHLLVCYIV